MLKHITIMIPVHNEELNIPLMFESLEKHTSEIEGYIFDYLFIDDGSSDNSVDAIEKLAVQTQKVKFLELSRNFGKEVALTAGLHHLDCDAVIVMDADLQHPPEKIPEFISEWEKGYEIVAAKRLKIENRNPVKRFGSYMFYKILNMISDVKMVSGSTDFRLLDRVVVKALMSFTERNRMFRGIIDWLGFRKTLITFEAPDRVHGSASYSFKKLFGLAVNSLTTFSLFPLKITGYLGMLITSVSTFLLIYMLLDNLFMGVGNFTPLAFAVVINTILIGVVLMALGLIALYIGHIHVEVVGRPLFVIRKKVNL